MSAPAVPARGGGAWIAFVVVLLAAVVGGNVALLRVASSDPSVAAEPDAYRKAEGWDDARAATDRSDRLGWSAGLSGSLRPDGAELHARLQLADAEGAPVAGATISIEAFAVARSGRRVALTGTTDASGVAAFLVPDGREGLWEWRVRARRGEQVFLATLRDVVARAPS